MMDQQFGRNAAYCMGTVLVLFFIFSSFALFMMLSDFYEALRMAFAGKSIASMTRAASRSRGLSAVTRGTVPGSKAVEEKPKAL